MRSVSMIIKYLFPIMALLVLTASASAGGTVEVDESLLTPLGRSLGAEHLDSDGSRLLWGLDGFFGTFRKAGDFWLQEELVEIVPLDLSDRDDPASGAVDGEWLALGFPDEGGAGGEVYLFKLGPDGWEQIDILNSNAATPLQFGASVDLEGDVLAIGDPDATDDGEVYIFERSGDTWSQVQTLGSADSRALDLGSSVELSGDLLVVGDPGYTADTAGQVGSIYVYRKSGGSFAFEQRLFSQFAENLGGDVAIGTDVIAGVGTGDEREAWVFEYDAGTWTFAASVDTDFGVAPTSVELSGDLLLISDRESYLSRRTDGAWPDSEYLFIAPGSFVDADQGILSGRTYYLPDGLEYRLLQALPTFEGRTGGNPGTSLASDGPYLLVGQPDAFGGGDRGRIQVYRRFGNEWQAFQGIEGEFRKSYGVSLDIEGDRFIVGGDNADFGFRGGANIYELEDGEFVENTLPEPVGLEDFDLFGISVGISGDWAAVGARGDDDNGESAGAVYLFERIGGAWTESAKLFPADPAAGDFFGFALAIDGDTLAVGARGDDDNGAESGSVYIFERQASLGGGGTWTETQKLTPTGAAASDAFGISLALEGDRLVVGANQGEPTMTQPGAAFVFERSGGTFTEDQKLTASDGVGSDSFGRAVALRGDRLVVGAPDVNGDIGKAYVFDFDGADWNETTGLVASDGVVDDRFGAALAVTAFGVTVGAPGDYWADVYDYRIFDPADTRDLAVTVVDSVDPATPGVPFSYTVTISNNSALPADGVAVSLDGSFGLELLSTSGCAEDPAGLPLCSLAGIGAMSDAVVTVTAQADPELETEVFFTAAAAGPLPDASPGDESVTESTQLSPEADLLVTLEATPNPVHAGDFLDFTARIENAGPGTPKEVELTAIQLPADVRLFSQEGCQGGMTYELSPCVLGWLEPGESEEVVFRTAVDSDAAGPLMAEATVVAETIESAPGDETGTISVPLASTPFLAFVESHVQGQNGVDGLTGVASVAINPGGYFVYASSPVDDEIAVFVRGTPGGACDLDFQGVATGAGGPLAISTDGRFLAAGDGDGVLLFERGAGGLLTQVDEARNGQGGVTDLEGVSSLTFTPDGFLRASAAGGVGAAVSFQVDGSQLVFAGSVTSSGSVFLAGLADLAFESRPESGVDYLRAVSPIDGTVYRMTIDNDDGQLSAGTLVSLPQVTAPSAVEVPPILYAPYLVAESSNDAVSLISTGSAGFLSKVVDGVQGEGLEGVGDVVFDTTGDYYFTAGTDEDAVGSFLIEPQLPGQTTKMGFIAAERNGLGGVGDLVAPTALAVAPGTSCLYVAASGSNALTVFEAASEPLPAYFFADGFESGDVSAWSETVP